MDLVPSKHLSDSWKFSWPNFLFIRFTFLGLAFDFVLLYTHTHTPSQCYNSGLGWICSKNLFGSSRLDWVDFTSSLHTNVALILADLQLGNKNPLQKPGVAPVT